MYLNELNGYHYGYGMVLTADGLGMVLTPPTGDVHAALYYIRNSFGATWRAVSMDEYNAHVAVCTCDNDTSVEA